MTQPSAEWNIIVNQGAKFNAVLTITDSNATAIDLSSATFSGSIKERTDDATALANFTFTAVDLVNGQIGISIPAATTATLDIDGDEAIHDIFITWSAGEVERALYGTVTFVRKVT